MARLFISILLFTTILSSMAQGITGKVVDENNTPLDFVNVVLINKNDSTFISGTITNEDGSFLFENAVNVPAFLKFSSTGYATISKEIPPTGNLGTVTLTPESVMLGEVVVKSDRPVTAIKGDALVTTVAGSNEKIRI